MNRFPGQISNRIEREDIIQEIVDRQEEEQKLRREEVLSKQTAEEARVLNGIRSCCTSFKSTSPDQWKEFLGFLGELNEIVYLEDSNTPFDYMKSGIHPEQWAINKAYLQGQTKILKSLTSALDIDMLQVELLLTQRRQKKSESFLQKGLTYLQSVLKRQCH